MRRTPHGASAQPTERDREPARCVTEPCAPARAKPTQDALLEWFFERGMYVSLDELTPLELRVATDHFCNGKMCPKYFDLVDPLYFIIRVVNSKPAANHNGYIRQIERLAKRAPDASIAQAMARAVDLLHELENAGQPNSLVSDTGASLLPVACYRKSRGRTVYDHYLAHYGCLPVEQRPYSDEVRRTNYRYWNSVRNHHVRSGFSLENLFPLRAEAKGGSLTKLRKSAARTANENPAEELARRRAKGIAASRAWRARKRAEGPKP
jgi:hypothetical protein